MLAELQTPWFFVVLIAVAVVYNIIAAWMELRRQKKATPRRGFEVLPPKQDE